MSDFSKGDLVWFAFTTCGRYAWPEATILLESHLELTDAEIVEINESRDCIYLYVKNNVDLVNVSYDCRNSILFKSKQECADAFKKRLDEL